MVVLKRACRQTGSGTPLPGTARDPDASHTQRRSSHGMCGVCVRCARPRRGRRPFALVRAGALQLSKVGQEGKRRSSLSEGSRPKAGGRPRTQLKYIYIVENGTITDSTTNNLERESVCVCVYTVTFSARKRHFKDEGTQR